jgi:2-keto-3-deoxy-L-rhamnonate aldolase RhmA
MEIMKEPFRSRLKKNETLLGTLVSLASLESVEILAEAGFDWFFVDLEHSPLGPREAQAILQVAGERVDCILRVPLNDEIWIKKALDTGAAGVMVPQVNSAEEARRAVRFSKYPPQGTRSLGASRAHGYGPRLQEYIERANTETAVIVQIEHIDAVRNLEAIILTQGIDGVLVGPYDLSASMGHIGQIENVEVQAAIAHVRQVCLESGMPLGIFAATAERARGYLQEGYRMIAASGDILMLTSAARQVVDQLRG